MDFKEEPGNDASHKHSEINFVNPHHSKSMLPDDKSMQIVVQESDVKAVKRDEFGRKTEAEGSVNGKVQAKPTKSTHGRTMEKSFNMPKVASDFTQSLKDSDYEPSGFCQMCQTGGKAKRVCFTKIFYPAKYTIGCKKNICYECTITHKEKRDVFSKLKEENPNVRYGNTSYVDNSRLIGDEENKKEEKKDDGDYTYYLC